MTRARWMGLLLLLLGSGIFIFWGASLERTALFRMSDFKAVYYGSRCLLQHCDPYNVSELEGLYRAEGWGFPSVTIWARQEATVYVNMPATFLFVAPIALLPWGPAHVLWEILIAGGVILAALLMWNLGAESAPIVSGCLIGFLLANCEVILAFGNTAGIVVSLCVIAAWCFLEERFVPAGIVCLAVSLLIKPHDAGLVWLYFLLAGGAHRKRALQTLAVAVALSLPAILWVSHVAPQWPQELHANLLAISGPGGLNDPGPTSITNRTAGMVIDLRSVISVFRDDPRVYNPVSYLFCGALLLVWLLTALRTRAAQANARLALAAVVPLTMLLTYHRSYDAKLLLLTIPACAMLWAEGGLTGVFALLVTAAAVVFSADIPLAILLNLARHLHVDMAGPFGKIATVVLERPATLVLLAASIFYLWMYVRRASARAATTEAASPGDTPAAPAPA